MSVSGLSPVKQRSSLLSPQRDGGHAAAKGCLLSPTLDSCIQPLRGKQAFDNVLRRAKEDLASTLCRAIEQNQVIRRLHAAEVITGDEANGDDSSRRDVDKTLGDALEKLYDIVQKDIGLLATGADYEASGSFVTPPVPST